MQFKEIKRFLGGGLNRDVEPSLMPENDYYDAHNALVDEAMGALVNARGTTSRSYAFPGLPGTTAKVVHAVEWKEENALIYFAVTIYGGNVSGRYIIKYDRNSATNTLVASTALLEFDDESKIQADIIGGILYWTDRDNSPHKLNIADAIAGTYTVNEQFLSAAQFPPSEAPSVKYESDGTRGTNNVRNKQFQFCYRWIMQDGEVSATSPISQVALPTLSEVGGKFADDPTVDNYISVFVLEGTELVKFVEIFVREGNTGDWGRIARLAKEDYGMQDSETGVYEFFFYNDDIPNPVDQDEINAVNDNFPQLADTQSFVDDGHMVYGGVTEGYPKVKPNISTIVKSEEINFSAGDGGVTNTFTLTLSGGSTRADLIMAPTGVNALPSAGDVLVFDFTSVVIDPDRRSTAYRFVGEVYLPGSAVESNDTFFDFITEYLSSNGALFVTQLRATDTIGFYWKGNVQFSTYGLTTEGASDSIGKTTGFKYGAVHPLGIVYFDKAGRHGGVNVNDDMFIDIPFYTGQYTSGTAISGDTLSLTVSGTPWTNDELLNKYIVMTSGAASGEIRRVAFNTSNYLTVDTVFSAAISNTDTFYIQNGYIRTRPTIRWQVKHQPPSWAHKWAWVYGGNQSVNNWTQYIITDDESGLSGNVTAVASAGSGKVTVTSASHGLSEGDQITIIGTTDYNGTFQVTNIDTDTFEIAETYVSSQTGTWTIDNDAIFNGVGDYSEFTFVNIRALNEHSVAGISDTVFLNSSIQPYVWQKGDRIRFITQENTSGPADAPLGAQVNDYYDLEILGYKGNDSSSNLLVVNQFSWAAAGVNIGTNSLVEIYTPKLGVEETVYYGMGQVFDVGNPGDTDRYHGGEFQDQDPADLTGTPATGALTKGDAYYYTRQFSDFLYLTGDSDIVESKSMSDIYDSDAYNKGKGFVIYDNPQTKKYKFFRWSNKYFPDSPVNGLSKFNSSNRTKQLDEAFGDIVAAQQSGFTLRVIQEKRPTSIYIGRTFIESDGVDDAQIATSSKVLGTIRPLEIERGTVFLNSVTTEASWTYYYDIYNGEVIRFSRAGVDIISDYGMKTWFRDKSRTLLSSGISNIDVISIFDREHKSLVITFLDSSDSSNNETIVFHEPTKKWISFMSFTPEMYGIVGDRLYSSNGGSLFEHDGGGDRMSFYGVQYDFIIKSVANMDPNKLKVLDALGVETNNNYIDSLNPAYFWDAEITVPVSGQYPYGQKTEILAQNWLPIQNRIYAPVLRDMFSTGAAESIHDLVNGRKMLNNFFFIKLTHSSPDEVTIKSISSSMTYAELS